MWSGRCRVGDNARELINKCLMKRIVLGIVVSIVALSCDPIPWDYCGFIGNQTCDTLIISSFGEKRITSRVSPGDSLYIFGGYYQFYLDYIIPPFDKLFEIDSVLVYDLAGTELRKWVRSVPEEKGRDIFDESEWECHDTFSEFRQVTYYSFNLTDEDIALERTEE